MFIINFVTSMLYFMTVTLELSDTKPNEECKFSQNISKLWLLLEYRMTKLSVNRITYLGDASLNQVGWKHIPATERGCNKMKIFNA